MSITSTPSILSMEKHNYLDHPLPGKGYVAICSSLGIRPESPVKNVLEILRYLKFAGIGVPGAVHEPEHDPEINYDPDPNSNSNSFN